MTQNANLASLIDHTLLSPLATHNQIAELCREALQFGFAAVCVPPNRVKQAAEALNSGSVKVASVVGFPLGYASTLSKVYESEDLVNNGAHELDMVMSLGQFKDKNYAAVIADIQAVVRAAPAALIKVIIETCYLTDAEITDASQLVRDAGAHFVKTSTGFGSAGADSRHIGWIREVVGPEFGIKASGGIRSRSEAMAMLAAGATRIGASRSVEIVTEAG